MGRAGDLGLLLQILWIVPNPYKTLLGWLIPLNLPLYNGFQIVKFLKLSSCSRLMIYRGYQISQIGTNPDVQDKKIFTTSMRNID